MSTDSDSDDGLGCAAQDEVCGGVLPLLPTPAAVAPVCGAALGARRVLPCARARAWACVTGSVFRASGSTYQQLLDDYLASKQFKPAFEVLAKIPADSVTLSFARFLHA